VCVCGIGMYEVENVDREEGDLGIAILEFFG
jgi:hypothetical protein